MLRVMLVDDHGFVRSAIRQALTASDIEVVGEAPSAEEALRIAPELRPDVVLIDIDLPGMNGLRLLRELRPRLPDCKFVMLTVSTRTVETHVSNILRKLDSRNRAEAARRYLERN